MIGRDKDNIKDQIPIWTDTDQTRQKCPYSNSHTDMHLKMPHQNGHSVPSSPGFAYMVVFFSDNKMESET